MNILNRIPLLFLLNIFLVNGYSSAETFSYSLDNLKPVSLAQYNVTDRPGLRQFFQFQNEEGMHFIVYEEVKGIAGSRELDGIRVYMSQWDSACNLELVCKTKAFCTGDCRNMYYEMTNSPNDTVFPERNNCTLESFTCEKRSAPQIPNMEKPIIPATANPEP